MNKIKDCIIDSIANDLKESELKDLNPEDVFSGFFQSISDSLAEGKRVEIRNLGVFFLKERKARDARNPRKGTKVHVDSRNYIRFKCGKKLYEELNI